jgi:hypothetical protein
MAIKYDTEDLKETLDKLDAQLSKSEPEPPDTAADLVKSLTEVAKGAIDLASERKEKRRAKKEAQESTLAKARAHDKEDHDEKDEDEDEDDKEDKLPHWLKDKVDDGKAAGEMQYAGKRDDYGDNYSENAGHESRQISKNIGHMGLGKSVQIGDQEVYDVGDYLAKSLAQQSRMAKALERAERREKALINGLIEMESRLQQLEAQNDQMARFTGTCAKALGFMLDHREAYLEQPMHGSRYATMEKSIALAQRQIEHDGGTVFLMKARSGDPGEVARVQQNKELLTHAAQNGKITREQMTYIKRTERLPAGITLN